MPGLEKTLSDRAAHPCGLQRPFYDLSITSTTTQQLKKKRFSSG